MDKSIFLKNMIGKKIKQGIYNDMGGLIIPLDTVITYDHVSKLVEHGITVNDLELEEDDPHLKEEHDRMIDEAVGQVSKIFNAVRETRKISLKELRKDVISMIHNATEDIHFLHLFSALQAKDDYTYRHNIAVGAIANLIGKWMELPEQDLLQLTTAALLHDVGKMLIPDYILNKPERLTSDEYEVMKKHTIYGYEILKETIGISHRQAVVALHHHERMDGSGYPFGIKEDQIDLFSRIVSIADVFHAMTSNRTYREPLPFYEVLFQMERDTFGALDPVITRLFIAKIMSYLIGYSVLLTDGRKAVILMIHTHDPTRPLVQVADQFIDLSKDFSLHIKKIL